MDGEKPLFAAIYARTSSPNQRFNYSIRQQINYCWRFCEERGWIVRYVFADEGESGGTVERPKFQLMLKRANAEKFGVIVFWKLDRFCRSLVDLVNTERMLRGWSIGLCSVTEFIDTTTPVGRFNFRNIGSFSELERELIGERARMGLYALAKEQKWPNPHPPFGYDRRNDGKLVMNVDESRLVKWIFEIYLRDKSMPQLAFELNKQGIRTKKGKEWNARGVRGILTNEIYIGKYKVAGVDNFVEEYRIVDDDLLKKANETMLRYKARSAKRPPMPRERKVTKIDNLFNRYAEFLGELEQEGLLTKEG